MTSRCLALLLSLGGLWSSLGAVPVKIACIGDSITQGAGLSNPSLESYPARLQRLLGTNYVVRNYGVSGRTLLKLGDYPYWKETVFKTSHDWGPDIVLIMLGTNDAKPYNWKYGTNFVTDYEALIASYANLTNAPRILLCTPCPVFRTGAFDIRPGTVATNIAPAIRDIAARLNREVIDMQVRLANYPEFFPDTVHPNSKGMAAMAAVVFDALVGRSALTVISQIAAERISATRVVLTWPGDRAGLVPQTAAAFGFTNTVWSVAEQVIYRDGASLRQTNTLSGTARFYRLWQP